MCQKYSIEDIYKLFGQYDWMATFFFKTGSQAYKKYGQYVTGSVDYNFKERKKLEKTIKQGNYKKTKGKVCLKYHLNDKDEDYISSLKFGGFNSSDIQRIDYLPWERENKFTNDDSEKEVPNIIKIPISDIPNIEKLQIENIKLKTFESRFDRDAALLYEERCEYIGILKALLKSKIPQNVEKYCGLPIEKVHNNDLVHWNYLKTKDKREGLTGEEKITLIDLDMKHITKNLKVFDAELKKALGNDFELSKHKRLYQFVKDEVAKFRKERLLQINYMIYWDIRGFCHTYLRHVKETQVGGKSSNKSTIPYRYKEIKRLIQQVLRSVKPEIKAHHSNHANKPFKRVGPRAIYYNGDYYYVVIEPDGRLESFYPKDRHHEKT